MSTTQIFFDEDGIFIQERSDGTICNILTSFYAFGYVISELFESINIFEIFDYENDGILLFLLPCALAFCMYFAIFAVIAFMRVVFRFGRKSKTKNEETQTIIIRECEDIIEKSERCKFKESGELVSIDDSSSGEEQFDSDDLNAGFFDDISDDIHTNENSIKTAYYYRNSCLCENELRRNEAKETNDSTVNTSQQSEQIRHLPAADAEFEEGGVRQPLATSFIHLQDKYTDSEFINDLDKFCLLMRTDIKKVPKKFEKTYTFNRSPNNKKSDDNAGCSTCKNEMQVQNNTILQTETLSFDAHSLAQNKQSVLTSSQSQCSTLKNIFVESDPANGFPIQHSTPEPETLSSFPATVSSPTKLSWPRVQSTAVPAYIAPQPTTDLSPTATEKIFCNPTDVEDFLCSISSAQTQPTTAPQWNTLAQNTPSPCSIHYSKKNDHVSLPRLNHSVSSPQIQPTTTNECRQKEYLFGCMTKSADVSSASPQEFAASTQSQLKTATTSDGLPENRTQTCQNITFGYSGIYPINASNHHKQSIPSMSTTMPESYVDPSVKLTQEPETKENVQGELLLELGLQINSMKTHMQSIQDEVNVLKSAQMLRDFRIDHEVKETNVAARLECKSDNNLGSPINTKKTRYGYTDSDDESVEDAVQFHEDTTNCGKTTPVPTTNHTKEKENRKSFLQQSMAAGCHCSASDLNIKNEYDYAKYKNYLAENNYTNFYQTSSGIKDSEVESFDSPSRKEILFMMQAQYLVLDRQICTVHLQMKDLQEELKDLTHVRSRNLWKVFCDLRKSIRRLRREMKTYKRETDNVVTKKFASVSNEKFENETNAAVKKYSNSTSKQSVDTFHSANCNEQSTSSTETKPTNMPVSYVEPNDAKSDDTFLKLKDTVSCPEEMNVKEHVGISSALLSERLQKKMKAIHVQQLNRQEIKENTSSIPISDTFSKSSDYKDPVPKSNKVTACESDHGGTKIAVKKIRYGMIDSDDGDDEFEDADDNSSPHQSDCVTPSGKGNRFVPVQNTSSVESDSRPSEVHEKMQVRPLESLMETTTELSNVSHLDVTDEVALAEDKNDLKENTCYDTDPSSSNCEIVPNLDDSDGAELGRDEGNTFEISWLDKAKARFLFLLVRYPNSELLSQYFPDPRKTNQLLRYFGKLRVEFFNKIEHVARKFVADGAFNTEQIHKLCNEFLRYYTSNASLILIPEWPNNTSFKFEIGSPKIGKNRSVSAPLWFKQIVERSVQEFYNAIRYKNDEADSLWKLSIYHTIYDIVLLPDAAVYEYDYIEKLWFKIKKMIARKRKYYRLFRL